MQSAGDIPLQVTSENSSSERRITPSWTIGQLKAKLEPVTGVPPLSQKLVLKLGGQQSTPIEAADEENTQLSAFPLAPYAEILGVTEAGVFGRKLSCGNLYEAIRARCDHFNEPAEVSMLPVTDTRPVGLRPNYTDPSKVEKYTLPTSIYETKTDSVLAWKKANKLGRFDPSAPSVLESRLASYVKEASERGIEAGKRCRVGADDTRRGTIMYVGEVEEIAKETGDGGLGRWVGVKFDEPVGKNDGSIGGKRYWGKDGDAKFGVFVRPERIEVGEFPMLDDLEDMEEI